MSWYDLFRSWLSTEEEDEVDFYEWLNSQFYIRNDKIYTKKEVTSVLKINGTNFAKYGTKTADFSNSIVDWGDGTIESSTAQLAHTYANNGEHTIKIIDAPYSSANCFYGRTNLTSIIIPSSVTSLGDYCFQLCSNLTSVTLPRNITTLGQYCFQNCPKLTSITIPSSVTSLGYSCFSGCKSLTSITIPSGVTKININCFTSCESLTSITIPSSVTLLDQNCFSGCKNLTSITIPPNVTTLNINCFSNCTSLTSITIPSSVTSLGNGCFASCSNLINIILNWTTSNAIVTYNNKWITNANDNLKFTIPQGTTQLYIDKGYPSDKLQEVTI